MHCRNIYRQVVPLHPKSSPGPWDTSKLTSSPEPSITLRGYRIAVMVNDDTAPLAQSAGADILLIHEDAPSSSQTEFESWWKEQLNKANTNNLVLVVVNSSSKACKQFSNWLKHCEHVRYTHAKNIAKAITNNNGEGELLKDTHMDAIQKFGSDQMETEVSVAKPTEDDTIEFGSGGSQNDSHVGDNTAAKESTKRTRYQEEKMIATRTETLDDEQQPTNRQKRRRRNDSNDIPIQEKDEAEGSRPVTTDAVKAAAQTKKKVVDESSDDEPGIPAERIPLPTTEDGWLMAAPRRRKAYRKEMDQVALVDAEVPDSAAETEKVSGLIVRQYNQTTGRSRIAQKHQGFKRCKPPVLHVYFIDFMLSHGSLVIVSQSS